VKAGKSRGKDLTEGGFGGDDGDASFNSNIGLKNDPGRLADLKYERANADAAGSAAMPKQRGVTGDNEYNALRSDTTA